MLPSRLAVRCLFVVLIMSAALPPVQAANENRGAFVDDDRSRFEPYIEAAHSAGLVSGCNPPSNDRFCPHREVSRGEMAVMLARSLRLPVPATDHFDDDEGHAAERAANALAAAGVTRG